MLIEGADYFVRLVPFPPNTSFHACVLLNSDATYTVLLDSNIPSEAQKKAMRHEYDHMANDDMYGDKDIREIERI